MTSFRSPNSKNHVTNSQSGSFHEILKKRSRPLLPLSTGVKDHLHPLKDIAAVLFDVYGTLFISGSGDVGTSDAKDNSQALTEALETSGYRGDLPACGRRGSELLFQAIERSHAEKRRKGTAHPEVDIRKIWHTVINTLYTEGFLEFPGDEGMLLSLAIEYESRTNPVWPMPALKKTLESLQEKNILLGIVSNAQFYTPYLFKAFLDGFPQETGFKSELCAWSYKALEAKPSPRLFAPVLEKLLDRYGVPSQNVLYVGNDMLNDIWTAAQTGCKTCLFAGDRRSYRPREEDPRCVTLAPDLVITKLSRLPGLLTPPM